MANNVYTGFYRSGVSAEKANEMLNKGVAPAVIFGAGEINDSGVYVTLAENTYFRVYEADPTCDNFQYVMSPNGEIVSCEVAGRAPNNVELLTVEGEKINVGQVANKIIDVMSVRKDEKEMYKTLYLGSTNAEAAKNMLKSGIVPTVICGAGEIDDNKNGYVTTASYLRIYEAHETSDKFQNVMFPNGRIVSCKMIGRSPNNVQLLTEEGKIIDLKDEANKVINGLAEQEEIDHQIR